jgi:hypothetical protein
MALWGKNDEVSNTAFQWLQQLQVTPNTANRTAAFGNTSAWYANNKQVAGIFGVSAAETAVLSGNVAIAKVSSPGSGYTANAAVTITVTNGGTSAVINAHANSTGYIDALNIEAAGSGYKTNPTIAIAAPSAITFNANTAVYKDNTFNAATGVANTTEFITTSVAHGLSNGDKVQYLVSAGNTAIGGLTNASSYYITNANTTAFTLSATSGGANVNLTAIATSETGHTLRRVGQGYITIASNVLQVGDAVTYLVAASNTALTGLSNNTTYYVTTSNSSTISLAAAAGGAAIVLTPGVTESGHSVTGQTATGYVAVGGGENKGVTAGWNLRTAGTGGRAGRVQYECLVAMRNITSDASDDSILPDA